MSIDLEYAISKDIRNNPVVRQADARQKREFFTILALVVVGVAALLFSAKSSTDLRLAGYRIERLRQDLEAERAANRKLQLNLETLRAPSIIERRAKAIGFRQPTLTETAVIQIAPETTPSGALVAFAR